jgi:hypothetical protein
LSELPEWAACLVFLVVVLFFAMVVESEGGEERKVSREDGRKCGFEVKQAWEQQVDSRRVAGMGVCCCCRQWECNRVGRR